MTPEAKLVPMTPEMRDRLTGAFQHGILLAEEAANELVAAYDSAPSLDEAQARLAEYLRERNFHVDVATQFARDCLAAALLTDREAQ